MEQLFHRRLNNNYANFIMDQRKKGKKYKYKKL